MNHHPIVRLLLMSLCLGWSIPCWSDSHAVVLLEAAQSDSASPAELINATEAHYVEEDGQFYLTLNEENNAYRKTEWLFKFHDAPWRSWDRLVLEVTFFDKGVGVIQPALLGEDSFNGKWFPPIRGVSFTRLNSLRERRSLFEFDVPPIGWEGSTHAHLKFAGLQYLRSVRAYPLVAEEDWSDLRDSIPVTVEPLVRLERPMEITCTVGIEDVGNPPSIQKSLDNIREYAPLAKRLGFTSIECFVSWDMLEPQPGEFDFSHYDRMVEEIAKYDLKWFPNLVITSAFALPLWYFNTPDNVGMKCLEHGEINQVPSIWNDSNRLHVSRVLKEFGTHYEHTGILEAVRLGPSGNFGEAQYPAGAGAALGHQGKPMHAHIGWWCGDSLAKKSFQKFLESRYGSIANLNAAWEETFADFTSIEPTLPESYRTRLGRFDMTDWYSQSMTDWCDYWARQAREAMPNTRIYQSSGGWGFREAGTDFSAQAQSMRNIRGGIRLTNETDSFEQNFYATRLAATAARLFGISLGYEPAGYHSARGVVARFFSTATTNGTNLYTRHSVLFTDPFSVENWLRNYSVLDQRDNPIVDVGVYYPETMNQLDDGTFRHLYGWGFNPRAAEIRRRIEVDFLDDRLIDEGFLEHYKVLVFCWGNILPTDTLDKIDRWIRKGGVAIFPSFPRGEYQSVAGDSRIFRAWEAGDTGKGRFFRFMSDMEPITLYGDYVESILKSIDTLHPSTLKVLRIEGPQQVFFSVSGKGTLFILNYASTPAEIQIETGKTITVPPVSIAVDSLGEN